MRDDETYAHECRIRDAFAEHLHELRPAERLVDTEVRYDVPGARADMRTVDDRQTVREWEFKIEADYSSLGQALVYVALARRAYGFGRSVRGVVAAFSFPAHIAYANEAMNLGLELVEIPAWMRQAGGYLGGPPTPGVAIPSTDSSAP